MKNLKFKRYLSGFICTLKTYQIDKPYKSAWTLGNIDLNQ